jgi:hypothetical protein
MANAKTPARFLERVQNQATVGDERTGIPGVARLLVPAQTLDIQQLIPIVKPRIADHNECAVVTDQRLAFKSILRGEAHQPLAKSRGARLPEGAAIGAVPGEPRLHGLQIDRCNRCTVEVDNAKNGAHGTLRGGKWNRVGKEMPVYHSRRVTALRRKTPVSGIEFAPFALSPCLGYYHALQMQIRSGLPAVQFTERNPGMPVQLQVASDVLFQTVADEAVLLNISDSHYYGLDDIATRMWQLLVEHGEAEAVIRQMLDEYEVEETTLRHDFATLVASMEERGLIKRVTNQ